MGHSEHMPFKQDLYCLNVKSYNIFFCLNCLPDEDGIHQTSNPQAIFTGSTIDHNKQCQVQFSTYLQAHQQQDNSLMLSTACAIALCSILVRLEQHFSVHLYMVYERICMHAHLRELQCICTFTCKSTRSQIWSETTMGNIKGSHIQPSL